MNIRFMKQSLRSRCNPSDRSNSFWRKDKGILWSGKSLEIDCLVEVHNEKELKKVVACGCDIIGINNRNLKTFDVDLNTTSKLAPLIPYEAVLVSESGMKDENDMKNVKEQGAEAVLIGETFMRSDNIKETMKQLRSCLWYKIRSKNKVWKWRCAACAEKKISHMQMK